VILGVLGLLGAATTAFLLLDSTKIGLTIRQRASLVGWLVTPLSFIALVLIEIFPHRI
jgi:hypothetical protein